MNDKCISRVEIINQQILLFIKTLYVYMFDNIHILYMFEILRDINIIALTIIFFCKV